MTSKDLIINFCRKKDAILFRLTGIHLFNEKDYKEILKWDTRGCSEMRLNAGSDLDCCPWCVYYGEDCLDCGFGLRHGDCMDNDDSHYGCVCLKLEPYSAFCKIPGIKTLVDWFNLKQDRLKQKKRGKKI